MTKATDTTAAHRVRGLFARRKVQTGKGAETLRNRAGESVERGEGRHLPVAQRSVSMPRDHGLA